LFFSFTIIRIIEAYHESPDSAQPLEQSGMQSGSIELVEMLQNIFAAHLFVATAIDDGNFHGFSIEILID